MNNLVNKLAKTMGFVGMIVLFVAAGMSLIIDLASFPDGFLPVVGHLLLTLFDLAVMVAVPLTLVLRKERLYKYALAIVVAYWLVSMTYGMLSDSDLANGNYTGITVAVGVFNFFVGACLLGSIVLAVLYVLLRKKMLLQIAFCVLAGSLAFFLLDWILTMARYAKFGVDWLSYFAAINSLLVLPTGIVMVLWHFLGTTLATPQAETASDAKAEETTEDNQMVEDTADNNADATAVEAEPVATESVIDTTETPEKSTVSPEEEVKPAPIIKTDEDADAQ